MRRVLALVAAALVLLGGGLADAAGAKARLRVVAPADMPFRTLYLQPGAFNGSRSWTLAPGYYVVVQAPPVAGVLTVRCTNGQNTYGGITLRPGEDVTCTFSVG